VRDCGFEGLRERERERERVAIVSVIPVGGFVGRII